MKVFRNLKEFFWPLLDEDDESTIIEMTAVDVTVADRNLEKTLEYALRDFQSEEDRNKSVESKSSLFIGTISVITTIVIAVTTVLVKEAFSLPSFLLIVLLFILTIYMARTIWFSIQALERRSYNTFDAGNFLIQDDSKEYHKKLIADIINITRKNSRVINSKVDCMVQAQEYFKRAIVVVTIYSFVVIVYFLTKSNFATEINFGNVYAFVGNLNLTVWNLIIIYSLILISIVLSAMSLRRKRK